MPDEKQETGERAYKKKGIEETIDIPEKVEIMIENGMVYAKGEKGEVSKKLSNPLLEIKRVDNKIVIRTERFTKREKKLIYTAVAHIRNMIKGVQDGYVYKLRICSSHFPIKATVVGDRFEVRNFLGERKPRNVAIRGGTKITVDGNTVIVEGVNKEAVSQQAADIEQLCYIKNRDRRVFQDGIYIIEKAGKSLL